MCILQLSRQSHLAIGLGGRSYHHKTPVLKVSASQHAGALRGQKGKGEGKGSLTPLSNSFRVL